MTLEFKPSDPLTLGVEIELQIVNTRDYNLTRGSTDLLAAVGKAKHPGDIKPEITESMIEIATGVTRDVEQVERELTEIGAVLRRAARVVNLGLCGGGAHPFQQWTERRIYDTPRFKRVSDLYGYLAKQFTVFGQHIHIGCKDGDVAVYLTQALARYMPQLIALSASSPYLQGTDTLFDSSRSNVVSAFPLSGTMPAAADWASFNGYFETMRGYGIVESMKDFYWDIRPKPEYGTVEIRVCDTPLTPHRAAILAGYAQSLAAWLLAERAPIDMGALGYVYPYNRFQACRFGLHATVVDPTTRQHVDLGQEVSDTIVRALPHAERLGARDALTELMAIVKDRRNDARQIREQREKRQALGDVVRWQCEMWMGQ
jgi:carboxylate-amine ligase